MQRGQWTREKKLPGPRDTYRDELKSIIGFDSAMALLAHRREGQSVCGLSFCGQSVDR